MAHIVPYSLTTRRIKNPPATHSHPGCLGEAGTSRGNYFCGDLLGEGLGFRV